MDEPFPQDMLKSDLLSRLAINLDTAEEVGPIAEIWVNGRTHQVKGIGCSGGRLLSRQSRRFLWSQIGSIGRDGVVVKAGAQLEAIDEHLQDALPLGDVELWSDHGDRVGQLVDYRFDLITGNILQYLFVPAPDWAMAAGLYALAPVAVISTGRRRMMAAAAALGQAILIQAGVQAEPVASSTPFDRLPLDRMPDPRQSWDAAVKTTRRASDRLQDGRQKLGAEAQDRRQQLQAEAQDKLGGLLGNVKKRTRRLRHQLREAVTDATAGLPSGSNLRHDDMPTIDVNAMELWPEDEQPER
ncbi:hypothetical protein IQ254_08520 [Nodosilinea sp. LEGE 07088]|uniref:PRC-barrel domain-containing protein n=1 Tax=Nodosilinea sp. LEGE 07088 TaxID=2777968 RepID=UPI00187FC97F|nr:hypothetical protein [Nodosilinea sp. LEGE 07088]MBE9137249.1 hypothetical protein [Nodosilinea sp. LEGE 07088]